MCGGCNGLVCILGDICLMLDLANPNLPNAMLGFFFFG